MNTINSKSNYKIIFLNIIFSLIPLSFIVGNLPLNTNIVALILLPIIFFRLEVFKIQINFIDKIIFFFFFYIFFVGLINFSENYNTRSVEVNLYLFGKSFFYLRYLLLYIVIRFLIEKNFLNLKWFFISSSFFTIFVCLDLIYQYYSGQSIFGYEPVNTRTLSGPFGDEAIAGGYIQRFFIFFIFLFLGFFNNSFFNNKKIYLIIIITAFIGISTVGIILSGNRMPFVLFVMMLFLYALFEKKIRYSLFFLVPVIIVAFNFLPNNSEVRKNVGNFIQQSSLMVNYVISWKIDRDDVYTPIYNGPVHFAEFETFFDTWKMNKIIGGGIRSFRINCPKRNNVQLSERATCNTHPHNYYLEILTDLGLIGLIVILILFSIILYRSLIKMKFIYGNYLSPFFFIFVAEIFPFKSTGSFFTTTNSIFLFLILSILVGSTHQKNDQNISIYK